MKKILTMTMICLLLGGCASSVKWQDVQSGYEELYQEAVETAAAYDSCSRAEFSQLAASVYEKAKSLSSGISAEKQEDTESLYRSAVLLSQLASRSNSIQADQLSKWALSAEELIKAAYEKSSDFNSLKQDFLSKGEQILAYAESDWSLIEFRKKILWNDVKSSYDALEEETLSSLVPVAKLSEADLEELKNIILNNYRKLLDGVDEENRKNADVLFEAAVALKGYTDGLEGETAEKVALFASQAVEFVKASYGESINDPDYRFIELAESAEKWTLSVWNELIKLINL